MVSILYFRSISDLPLIVLNLGEGQITELGQPMQFDSALLFDLALRLHIPGHLCRQTMYVIGEVTSREEDRSWIDNRQVESFQASTENVKLFTIPQVGKPLEKLALRADVLKF